MEDMRLVVVGRVGAGKSSLANTICEGREVFGVHHTASSHSKDLWWTFTTEVHGRNIHITDTPGFYDTDPTSEEFNLKSYIRECSPGPHAFLLVLKVEKFTSQEQDVVDIMRRCFSDEALKYTTVVFTHGNDLPKGMSIEEWVNQNDTLENLVRKCGGRVHVVDSKYWNNKDRVKQLLLTVSQTVITNGGHFSADMLPTFFSRIMHLFPFFSQWCAVHIRRASSNCTIKC